jgi:putative flippase GtrA
MQPERATSPEPGLQDWGRQLAGRLHLPTTLVKFLIVGGIGFLINQFVLFLSYDSPLLWFFPEKHTHLDLALLTAADSRLLFASIMAVEVAIICQFNFHERWTFRKRNRGGNIFARFAKYNLSAAVSPLITVICVNTLTPVFRDAAGSDSLIGRFAPYMANTVGVLLGFSWNYALNTLVIWPHQRREEAAA